MLEKSRKKNSKIKDKLQNGHLIYTFEDKGNWTYIDYTKKDKEGSGFIYKDRYKLVSKFPAFKITKETDTSITLIKDSIEVTITQSRFDKKKHSYKFYNESLSIIKLIDNKQYWGSDGGIPTSQFEKITIKIGTKIITLPKNAIEGLYQPSIYTAEVNYDNLNNTIYIQTSNSDGAGSYFVIWKIQNGVYCDRLLVYGF